MNFECFKCDDCEKGNNADNEQVKVSPSSLLYLDGLESGNIISCVLLENVTRGEAKRTQAVEDGRFESCGSAVRKQNGFCHWSVKQMAPP